jgi:hypothetical protein
MPWEKYREHANAHAFRADDPADLDPPSEVFYMRAHTPNTPAEWSWQMRRAHPAHGVTISEPSASNPMQSPPFVLFASYDARGQYRTGAHSRITKTHPYVITTYTEGDLVTEFYATADARDRALYLLERAL